MLDREFFDYHQPPQSGVTELGVTLKELEAFYWSVKLGSFSAAAVRLCVTQSTLSKRIAELERDLAQRLFERLSPRLALTDAGARLFKYALEMLHLENQIRGDLGGMSQIRGVCRLGISELVAMTWFPLLVQRVGRNFPELTLEPQVDLAQTLMQRIQRGELDCGVFPGEVTSPALERTRIAELEYRWMASPSRFATGHRLDAADFAETPVIALAARSSLAGLIDKWSERAGYAVPKALTCNSLSALIALVVSGVGISHFPRIHLQPLVLAGKLVELDSDPPLPGMAYHFVWRKDDKRQLIPALGEAVSAIADFSHAPLA